MVAGIIMNFLVAGAAVATIFAPFIAIRALPVVSNRAAEKASKAAEAAIARLNHCVLSLQIRLEFADHYDAVLGASNMIRRIRAYHRLFAFIEGVADYFLSKNEPFELTSGVESTMRRLGDLVIEHLPESARDELLDETKFPRFNAYFRRHQALFIGTLYDGPADQLSLPLFFTYPRRSEGSRRRRRLLAKAFSAWRSELARLNLLNN